jgi:proliferating cell nuclear antigen PCNA
MICLQYCFITCSDTGNISSSSRISGNGKTLFKKANKCPCVLTWRMLKGTYGSLPFKRRTVIKFDILAHVIQYIPRPKDPYILPLTTMEIHIADAHLFRKSMDALRDFLPQAQIHVAAEGLRIRGMDASHVGFVDYFLSSQDCQELRVPADTVMGISTTILSKVLGTAGNAEQLKLSYKEDRLCISFTGEGRSASFEIPTLDINEDAIVLPEMSYGATVRARAGDMANLIRDVAMFGDEAILSLNDEGFHVRAEGDLGKGAMTLEPTDDRDMTLEGDSIEISFGMKYLQQIVKSCTPLAAYMEIAFDPAHPLRVTSRFGKASYFIAYLAPKVQED